jgi:DNA-binding PadR family transcriptional regulator
MAFWIGKSYGSDERDQKPGNEEEEALASLQGDKVPHVRKTATNLSPIEIIILAQLRSRELRNNGQETGQYGYEMMRDLNELFMGSWEAKSGTIYPILSKLASQKDMLVGQRAKSPLGPVKIVYYLTKHGRETIDAVIQESIQSDFDFMTRYFNLLTPFIQHIPDENQAKALFEQLAGIPAKGAILAMEQSITEVDHKLRREKLEILKAKLETVVKNIEQELAK